jgi:hypothetical protein
MVINPLSALIEPNLFNNALMVIYYSLLEFEGQPANEFDECLSDKKEILLRLPINP